MKQFFKTEGTFSVVLAVPFLLSETQTPSCGGLWSCAITAITFEEKFPLVWNRQGLPRPRPLNF